MSAKDDVHDTEPLIPTLASPPGDLQPLPSDNNQAPKHLDAPSRGRPPSPSVSATDSSSSSDDNHPFISKFYMSKEGKDGKAELVVTSASKVPILTSGDLDIEVVLRWVHACEEFFEYKDSNQGREKGLPRVPRSSKPPHQSMVSH